MSSQAEYKKLRKLWYKKLKESGFVDVEYFGTRSKDDWFVNGTLNQKFRQTHLEQHSLKGKQEYYQMASDFLNAHRFDAEIDKAIWNYHAEGISIRKIAKILNSLRLYTLHDRTKRPIKYQYKKVWKIIKKYKDIMKDKYLG